MHVQGTYSPKSVYNLAAFQAPPDSIQGRVGVGEFAHLFQFGCEVIGRTLLDDPKVD